MPHPSPSSRRLFLQSAGALSGLAAASSLAAADAKEPVRIAVIGTGARGCDLIRALATIDGADVVAVCDDYPPHLEHGAKFAGPEAQAFASAEAMLAKARPQAVVIATPLYLHGAMAQLALAAGCDVYCEKTMCYSLAQAQEVARQVAAKKAVFQVGLQRRANAIYKHALALIAAGMLGQITSIAAQWHRHNDWRRPVPVPRGQAEYAALDRRLNWRLYRDYSQGLMAELGSHQLDVASWLLGTGPTSVVGSGGIDYWRDGREVNDNVFCIFEYQVQPRPARSGVNAALVGDGKPYTVRVTYSSLQNNQYAGASELIQGTRGTLFLSQKKGLFYREAGVDDPGWAKDDRVQKDAALITSGKTLKMTNDPWAHRGSPFEIDADGDDTRDALVAFLNAVRTRETNTLCPAADGVRNTALVLAANEACATGKKVTIEAGD